MVVSIVANGLTTIWTESGFTLGKTAESMRVNTKTIKKMATGFIFGLMAASTRETGSRASNTA